MSLTPISPENARALAHLVEQERNRNGWWKQPARQQEPDGELPALARRLNREFMARTWRRGKVHASRYLYRRDVLKWRTRKAA